MDEIVEYAYMSLGGSLPGLAIRMEACQGILGILRQGPKEGSIAHRISW